MSELRINALLAYLSRLESIAAQGLVEVKADMERVICELNGELWLND